MEHDLKSTALHEAGHAVAFLRLFPRAFFKEVTIIPDYDEHSAGHVHPSMDTGIVEVDLPEEDADAQFLNHAIYLCSGYAALVVSGYPEVEAQLGCDDDFERAGSLVVDGQRRAVELLGQAQNREALRLIADELMRIRKLDHDQVSILMDVADREATMKEYHEFLALRETFGPA